MSSRDGNDDSNVNDLFEEAHAEGVLSPASLQTLTGVDLGAQIQAGLGITVDDVQASEVVLVTMMPDDSGSIRYAGNEQAVRDGHNLVLDALRGRSRATGPGAHPLPQRQRAVPVPTDRPGRADDVEELRPEPGHAALRPDRRAARHGARQGAGVRTERRRRRAPSR